jgi:nucleoside-diphosphate-sugar epimerase
MNSQGTEIEDEDRTALFASRSRSRVLVTGASGKIGRHVVSELLSRGYQVRALTSKLKEKNANSHTNLEWQQFDWHESLSFETLVEGCTAVLHLGAELYRIEKMQRSNVDAVRALARASERAGVRFFCHISSAAVYGSSLSANVTEDSPVLTYDRDIKSQYLAEDYLRSYGRTKLAGELTIQEEARRTAYVILRPTVVVDVGDLVGLASWSAVKKAMTGYRHSHQIYVLDVVHAMLWFMEKYLANGFASPLVNVYNLSNDDVADNTYGQFFRQVYRETADKRFKSIQLPSIFDRMRDVLKFRQLPIRHSLGTMRFSPERLYGTGYRHRYGIEEVHRRALRLLIADKQSTKLKAS